MTEITGEQYKAVVDNCKLVERLLERELGGHGRGLFEKAKSVETRIGAPLMKKAAWVAAFRNAMMHDADFAPEPSEIKRVIDGQRQLLAALEALVRPRRAPTRSKRKKPDSTPRRRARRGKAARPPSPSASQWLFVATLLLGAGALVWFYMHPHLLPPSNRLSSSPVHRTR